MKLFQPIQGSIESKETQENLIDRGQLQVNVTSSVNAFPVKEARISISYTGIPESTLEQVVTDSSGQTELVELNAPPKEWSLDENEERQPYSEYTLNIEAEGFESISISGTEILANTKAIQNVRMKQKDQSREEEQIFVIPAHTLYGNYPPKIAEEEIKPINETGEIVLSRVVVPEYIIVHDGSPRDSTAQNYYVKMSIGSFDIPPSWVTTTWNGLLCVVLGGVMAAIWKKLAERPQGDMNMFKKVALGFLFVGLAFGVMVVCELVRGVGADASVKASVFWPFLFVTVITIGEMCFSPLRNAFVSKYAPKKYLSLLMGVIAISTFGANKLSPFVQAFIEKFDVFPVFVGITVIMLVFTALIFLANKKLNSLVEGKEEA